MPVYQDRALQTTKVTVTDSDTVLSYSPPMRQGLIIENTDNEDCYISFGSNPITNMNHVHKPEKKVRWEITNPGTCEIHAICESGKTTDIIISEG